LMGINIGSRVYTVEGEPIIVTAERAGVASDITNRLLGEAKETGKFVTKNDLPLNDPSSWVNCVSYTFNVTNALSGDGSKLPEAMAVSPAEVGIVAADGGFCRIRNQEVWTHGSCAEAGIRDVELARLPPSPLLDSEFVRRLTAEEVDLKFHAARHKTFHRNHRVAHSVAKLGGE